MRRHEAWLTALLGDLQQNRGKSIVIAGETPASRSARTGRTCSMNQLGNIGKRFSSLNRFCQQPANQLNSLRELANEMNSGAVESLVILGGNPVYTAPADFHFASLLPKIKRSIHLGLYFDETAPLCTWHIPQAHYLESWGDARSFDGTVSLLQPLIAPLYGGKVSSRASRCFESAAANSLGL